MGKKRKLMAGAALAAAAVAGVHIINRAIFFNATLKERLTGASDTYFEWRFGKIYFTKQGSGRPLLLLHRLDHTASAEEWGEIRDDLAKTHTVYTLDLPGCGRSDKPKMIYTNYLYVQLLNEFIKEVIKGRTDIITSGNASNIAAMACLIEPSLYNRLVFLQPQKITETCKTPRANHKALKYIIETPVLGTCLYNMVCSRSRLKKKAAEVYFAAPEFISDDVIDIMSEAAHIGGSSAKYLYASVRCHFTDMYVGNAIKQLNHSIFVIGSDEEKSQEAICEYMDYNPAIESASIPGTRLLMQIEKPEQVLELCHVFLG